MPSLALEHRAATRMLPEGDFTSGELVPDSLRRDPIVERSAP